MLQQDEKTFLFKVVFEPMDGGWQACCPVFRHNGAISWGHTKEEAFFGVEELVKIILQDINDDSRTILVKNKHIGRLPGRILRLRLGGG